LRIFLDNKIKPIVLIAFTNHALDHMLNSILDAKITEKFVRLGSRSSDERIAQYSLRNLERTFPDAYMKQQVGRQVSAKKGIEEEMLRVIRDIQIPEPSENQIKEYLQCHWGGHLSKMYEPPLWIAVYAAQLWESEGGEDEWKITGKKGKGEEQSQLMARTYYGLWKRGLDIAFIQRPVSLFVEVPLSKGQKQRGTPPTVKEVPPTQNEQENYQTRMFEFFSPLDYGDAIPQIPISNRPLTELQNSDVVWSMSAEERRQLAAYWEREMRQLAYDDHLEEYETLRMQHEEACEKLEAVSDDVRARLPSYVRSLTFPAEEASFVEKF
jgi:hypothetical protein